MKFRTEVNIGKPAWQIGPREEILFVGSCFADSIGRRFQEEQFRATVNPFGVMYNPASILHTIQRLYDGNPSSAARQPVPDVAFLTLGTNHVYILKETGEIVDNCQKRPHQLFREEVLTVGACAGYLRQAVDILRRCNPAVKIVFTVSPIRYAKYGYHGSQLSKATLLLAVEEVLHEAVPYQSSLSYFPAYEIVNDELRDYRFYADDMLHPSSQAVEYIWQRFSEAYLSDVARQFVAEWQPVKRALAHKPFNPDGEEYRAFMEQTRRKLAAFQEKYGLDRLAGDASER